MNLGDRMKGYEEAARLYLTRRMPMIVRVDGKAFHTFTKKYEKPWDIDLRDAMTAAAKALVSEIQGAKLAYVQSDEISVLVTDYDKLESEPWFNKAIQKVSSVSASIATMAFNQKLKNDDPDYRMNACFDSRCFVLPKEEVCNYFIWRQQDAIRNSILGLGQKYFSHKEMHKKKCSEVQELLLSLHGVDWNKCEPWQKRGWSVVRKENTHRALSGVPVIRNLVEPLWNTPIFVDDRDFIENFVNIKEA